MLCDDRSVFKSKRVQTNCERKPNQGEEMCAGVLLDMIYRSLITSQDNRVNFTRFTF